MTHSYTGGAHHTWPPKPGVDTRPSLPGPQLAYRAAEATKEFLQRIGTDIACTAHIQRAEEPRPLPRAHDSGVISVATPHTEAIRFSFWASDSPHPPLHPTASARRSLPRVRGGPSTRTPPRASPHLPGAISGLCRALGSALNRLVSRGAELQHGWRATLRREGKDSSAELGEVELVLGRGDLVAAQEALRVPRSSGR
jgi:hypothetical protein